MRPAGVLLVVDGRGHILDRLAGAWAERWSAVPHTLAYSAEQHAYDLRRSGARAGLLHWVDPLAFAVAPKGSTVPQVVMVHHLTEPEVAPMIHAVKDADALTTSSVRWQRRLQELTGRPVTVVPYTIDTRLFHLPADRRADRARLGFSEDAYVIGFSAKAKADAYGRKGLPLFREILGEGSRRWRNPAVLLIGAGWETEAAGIRAMGLQVVHIEPPTADATAGLYPAMDVFLCTSNEEGGPCTILEAMACGVPIVTTDVGHVPEVVEDSRNGFVVQDRSARSFLEAMAAVRDDREKFVQITAEARSFVERERDHETGLRSVDIQSVYAAAIDAFQARSIAERPLRAFSRAVLGARSAARRLRGAIRQE